MLSIDIYIYIYTHVCAKEGLGVGDEGSTGLGFGVYRATGSRVEESNAGVVLGLWV